MMSFQVTCWHQKKIWVEIESDMATKVSSKDVQREENNEKCVTTGRARNAIMNRIRGEES